VPAPAFPVHSSRPHPYRGSKASTLIVYGVRDPLNPVEMAIAMYRAIPRSELWVLPNGGHGPVFFDAAVQFAQTVLAFLRTSV
jgi:pimeloyl-ACP methyl ester carboxylesterase